MEMGRKTVVVRVANACIYAKELSFRYDEKRENVTPRLRHPSRFEVDPRVPCIEGPCIEFLARNPS